MRVELARVAPVSVGAWCAAVSLVNGLVNTGLAIAGAIPNKGEFLAAVWIIGPIASFIAGIMLAVFYNVWAGFVKPLSGELELDESLDAGDAVDRLRGEMNLQREAFLRILAGKELTSAEAFAKLVKEIDLEDGVADGRMSTPADARKARPADPPCPKCGQVSWYRKGRSSLRRCALCGEREPVNAPGA